MADRFMHHLGAGLSASWPRRLGAILAVLAAAWSLHAMDPAVALVPVVLAALQVLVAIALWKRQRWAVPATVVLQIAMAAASLIVAPRAYMQAGWWMQHWPHAVVIVMLLLPESRRSRAALRESGFEPGDTVPVPSRRR
ncbi:MAG: hypothetical protein K0R58_2083 [Ramlibacter sp.]|jgi:hypothetical protein|nr:hypothetical protein [Ramlibacter sp.]